jgi:hypothetical protein
VGAANGRLRSRAAEPDEPRGGQPRTGRQQVPPRRPQNSGGYPAPGGGEGTTRPPLSPPGQGAARPTRENSPPTQSSLPPSTAHSTGYGKPTTNGFRIPPKQQSSGPNPLPPGGGAPGQGPKSPAPGAPKPPHDAASPMAATRRVPAVAPAPTPQEGTLAARLEGLDEADEQESPTPGAPPQAAPAQQSSGRSPLPPRRRRPPRTAPAPPPEPHTEQLPAVAESDQEKTALSEPVRADEPPAGLVGWSGRRGSADAADDNSVEETQVHAATSLAGDLDPDDDEGPATGYYVPDFDDDDEDDLEVATRVGALDDDPLGEGGYGTAYAAPDGDDPYGDPYAEDDYDDGDEDDRARDDKETRRKDDEEEPVEDGSPAKQWLVLAGQLALGVAGGAGVWLGFNWLWGKLPAAALVAALLVTVGLVWVVRKVRRAEDTQTTVLALLVGLVVTVSPAALLLVSR